MTRGNGSTSAPERESATAPTPAAPASPAPEPDGPSTLDAPLDVDDLISRMTLSQKCSLLSGRDKWHTRDIPELGIPAMRVSDGPHGLRIEGGQRGDDPGHAKASTAFPSESTLACSFDTALLRSVGRAIGEECRKQGVGLLLAPGVNMKRSPLGGRNFEYLSEDPLLAGKLAAAYIGGVQSCGVGTSLKHFACNNQEYARMTSDSIVDDRALFEYYLRAFEIAIREGHPWTVMPAYNRLNGTYCCENPRLLTDIARNTWGFDGVFISDWGAESSDTASVEAGLDLVMPGPRPDYGESIKRAVECGELDERLVDDAVRRVLELLNRHIEGERIETSCNMERHVTLARIAAEESTVLLKNDGILPLPDDRSVALIGAYCRSPHDSGLGSSQVTAQTTDCAYDAFSELRTPADGELDAFGSVVFARAYNPRTCESDEEMLARAQIAAARQDVAVVFVGTRPSDESEGYDRRDLRLPPSHEELVRRVCAANPNTVVVLQCGGPIEMPWRDEPRAIVLQGFSGCRGGAAIANLLTGHANPGGHLAETWPATLEDTFLGTSFPDRHRRVFYDESLLVGYRYHDKSDTNVAYPFGHGLSYTTFAFHNLKLVTTPSRHSPSADDDDLSWLRRHELVPSGGKRQDAKPDTADAPEAGRPVVGEPVGALFSSPAPAIETEQNEQERIDFGQETLPPRRFDSMPQPPVHLSRNDDHLIVSFDVTNTGARRGSTVAQLYISSINPGVYRPVQELEGFAKLELDPGQTTPVRIVLSRRAFAHYEPSQGEFIVEEGEYEVRVGASSRDIRACAKVQVDGMGKIPDDAPAWYHLPTQGTFRRQYFNNIYQRPLPTAPPRTTFTIDSSFDDLVDSPLGRFITPILERAARSMSWGDRQREEQLREMLGTTPLRALHMNGVDRDTIEALVDFANGKLRGGMWLLARGRGKALLDRMRALFPRSRDAE